MREQWDAQNSTFQKTLEEYKESSRKELATNATLLAVKNELKEELANTTHEILKWIMGVIVAQTALIVAVIGVGIALLGK